jgi:hypothetical protein
MLHDAREVALGLATPAQRERVLRRAADYGLGENDPAWVLLGETLRAQHAADRAEAAAAAAKKAAENGHAVQRLGRTARRIEIAVGFSAAFLLGDLLANFSPLGAAMISGLSILYLCWWLDVFDRLPR